MSQLFFSDPCASVTCAIALETCVSGTCMCGTAATCNANINTAMTADACDATNNVCTCGGAAECTGGQTCVAAACA